MTSFDATAPLTLVEVQEHAHFLAGARITAESLQRPGGSGRVTVVETRDRWERILHVAVDSHGHVIHAWPVDDLGVQIGRTR